MGIAQAAYFGENWNRPSSYGITHMTVNNAQMYWKCALTANNCDPTIDHWLYI